jgi:MbtH protein
MGTLAAESGVGPPKTVERSRSRRWSAPRECRRLAFLPGICRTLPARPPFTFFKETTMARDEDAEDKTVYKVVLNHEEQYSIWPADRENALGWTDAGKSGSKAECLAYIKEVWTDMRPRSLRERMAQGEKP